MSTGTLAPEIARALGAREWTAARPSFLNWAAEEMERLRAQTRGLRREEKFELQNRIATLAAAAYAYGQYLYSREG